MQRLRKYYKDHIKDKKTTRKPESKLDSYSPFLAEFQGIELDEVSIMFSQITQQRQYIYNLEKNHARILIG